MTVDYAQLKLFVQEALERNETPIEEGDLGVRSGMAHDGPGGMMVPSAPRGVPHRMPAADPSQEKGDPKANKLYDVALVAREATEELVEALDDPIFDDAYEFAFKASAQLRRALNSLEQSGAKPTAQQRVVAPPASQQKYAATTSYTGPNASAVGATTFGAHPGGVALNDISEQSPPQSVELQKAIESYEALDDQERQVFAAYFAGDTAGQGVPGPVVREQAPEQLKGFGAGATSKSVHARGQKLRGQQLAQGDILQGITQRERSILIDVEKILTQVADEADLVKYRPILIEFLKKLLRQTKGTGEAPA